MVLRDLKKRSEHKHRPCLWHMAVQDKSRPLVPALSITKSVRSKEEIIVSQSAKHYGIHMCFLDSSSRASSS